MTPRILESPRFCEGCGRWYRELARCVCGCEVVYHRVDLPNGPQRCTHCDCKRLEVADAAA